MSGVANNEKGKGGGTLNGRKIAIGASFVGSLAVLAGLAGISWASSSAARDQHRMAIEEEEDSNFSQINQRTMQNVSSSKLLQKQLIENAADANKLAIEGRRLALRALGYGTLWAVGIVGSTSLLIWGLCGAPRTFPQFRDRVGHALPRLSKENAPRMETSEFVELLNSQKK